MSAAGLEAALRSLGIECAVETHERLAVLVPLAHSATAIAAEQWSAIETLARTHGFTHAAVELLDDAGTGAALPRH